MPSKRVRFGHDTGSDVVLVKIVTFFLVGMAILAMFGKLRLPKVRLPRAERCGSCGAPRVGRGPCPCKAGPKA